MPAVLRRLTLGRADVVPLAIACATAVVVAAGGGRDAVAVVVLSAVGLATATLALASRTAALAAVVALAFGASYAASLVGRGATIDPFAAVVAVLVYLSVESIVDAAGSLGVVVDVAARRHHARTLGRVGTVGAAAAVAVLVVAAALPFAGTVARVAGEAAAIAAAATIVVVARRRTDVTRERR